MNNNLYSFISKNDLKKIQELQKTNEIYQEHFKSERQKWNDKYQKLISKYIDKTIDANIAKQIDDNETQALLYRCDITSEIANYSNNLSIEEIHLKNSRYELTIFNLTGKSNLKLTSATQIKYMIESMTAERTRSCKMIENHIEFLRETYKDLNDYSWKINRHIELLKLLNT